MKFLIDECLSPTLVAMARERGFLQSTHVTWLGLRSRQDWVLVRRAIDDDYILVTHDSADFTALMEREPRHPGLVCMNVAQGLMSLDVQQTLFDYAITQIADYALAGHVVEITLTTDSTIRLATYPSASP